MVRIDWSKVKGEVKKTFEFFENQEVTPTLRTIFYRLHSKDVVPKTKNYYKTLSSKMVEWRKQGVFEWDCIKDKARISYGETEDSYLLEESRIKRMDNEVEEKIENIDINEVINSYFEDVAPYFYKDHWAKQNKIVEVWIEKEALADTFQSWLKDKHIKIRVNRGYSSWTFIYNNIQELREIADRHKKVVVIYVGDHDPSGLDIDRFLKEAMNHFDVDSGTIELTRGALNYNQIKKYDLPSKSVNKKDTRSKGYIEEYGDNAWDVDSLVAYEPNEFKKIIREKVDKHFSQKTSNKLQEKKQKLQKKANKKLEEAKEEAKEEVLTQIQN